MRYQGTIRRMEDLYVQLRVGKCPFGHLGNQFFSGKKVLSLAMWRVR